MRGSRRSVERVSAGRVWRVLLEVGPFEDFGSLGLRTQLFRVLSSDPGNGIILHGLCPLRGECYVRSVGRVEALDIVLVP